MIHRSRCTRNASANCVIAWSGLAPRRSPFTLRTRSRRCASWDCCQPGEPAKERTKQSWVTGAPRAVGSGKKTRRLRRPAFHRREGLRAVRLRQWASVDHPAAAVPADLSEPETALAGDEARPPAPRSRGSCDRPAEQEHDRAAPATGRTILVAVLWRSAAPGRQRFRDSFISRAPPGGASSTAHRSVSSCASRISSEWRDCLRAVVWVALI